MDHTKEGLKEEEREERLTTEDIAENMRHKTEATKPSEPAHDQILPEELSRDVRMRWDNIQTGFVDEPRRAVEQADSLVAVVMQCLAATFSVERKKLEGQWGQGDNVPTEDLRIALHRYRSFFGRLLSI